MEAVVAWITAKVGGFLGIIAGLVAREVLQFLFNLVKKNAAQKQKDKEIDEKTKKEADALKRSETDEEDERAAKDILSRRS